MSEEQARYDREFAAIVICHIWREQVAPLLRAMKPYLDAVRQEDR